MTADEEYSRRLGIQQARAAAARRRDVRLGAAKLATLAILLGLAWLALIRHLFGGWWLWLPALALAWLFLAHDRAIQTRARSERLAGYYQQGLARLQDHWSGNGASGERFRDPQHPYADDLDLFGVGGLFELVSGARTPMGEERLAAWMRAPAPAEEIRQRQRRGAARRNQLDLREEIAALGEELKGKLDPGRLAEWAQAPPAMISPLARWACAGIAAAALAAAAGGFATGRFAPFFALVLAEAILLSRLRRRVAAAIGHLGANGEGLALFAEVLARAATDSGTMAPGGARALRRLAHLADWIEACDSLLGRILDFTVLYSVQLAYAAEAWRRRHGAQMSAWLDAVAEFEALLSLARHAYEHPDDPYPEIIANSPGPIFRGEGLGHPLLPAAQCVRNSIALDATTRLLLVSGSNMSGKSTLLRTVGMNAALALMGAPVRAQCLQLTPLALGTRLRTADSLQQGRSGFYAEILRLRQIFELTTASLPVLFLLDELLEGTNSHDRVLGAEGFLRNLLGRPTLGLVTTHDLALTTLAEALGPVVRNVHFEDQIEGNDVRFDHCLRAGVVTKSNALKLMRIIGLEV